MGPAQIGKKTHTGPAVGIGVLAPGVTEPFSLKYFSSLRLSHESPTIDLLVSVFCLLEPGRSPKGIYHF